MKTKTIFTLCLVLTGSYTFAQQATITTFRVDGLIISKARYDSLRIDREHILKVRSLPPAQAASAYGSRAGAGVAEITTSKMFVVKPVSGPIQSASDPGQKETLLSAIQESQVLRLRNVSSAALQTEFGLANAHGAVVVELRQ